LQSHILTTAIVGTETAEITVLGSLTREEIERVINAHRNEVQFCYQRALQADPQLSGKITFKWTIVDGGQVSGIRRLQNTTASTSLESCLRDKIQNWRFPSPARGSQAVVDWPWTFRPKGL